MGKILKYITPKEMTPEIYDNDSSGSSNVVWNNDDGVCCGK